MYDPTKSPENFNLYRKLGFNEEDNNFGLCIRNLNTISPHLQKMDARGEFFTVECGKQLEEYSKNFIGPFKAVRKCQTGSQLYNLLVHLTENEMSGEVGCLCALFVYSQLNTSLLTGHTASPIVKTNRARLRVFIEKVNKGLIVLNEYTETKVSITNAEILLAEVILNDKIEEHKKTAILLGNIYKGILGNNNFSTMNQKKNGNKEPKEPRKRYPPTVKLSSGGSGKSPNTGGISDIYNFSKTVYVEKPNLDASASSVIIHEVFETSETLLISFKECKRFSQSKGAIENNYIQDHQRVLNDKEASFFYKKLLLQFEQVDSFEQKKSILGMMFILLIGLDDTWLSDIVIVNQINDYHHLNKGKILVSTMGCMQFYQIELPHAYHPKKNEYTNLLSNKNQLLTLPLPESLVPILIEIKGAMKGSEFNADKVIYDEEFNKMRSKLTRRFTNDKLREFSFNLYYRQSNEDEIYATLLKPVSPYLIPSSCYYSSINLIALREVHTSAFTKVFGQCVPHIDNKKDVYLGSKLCINAEKIKDWLSTLKENIKKDIKGCRSLDELIFAHNNYVMYVSTILLITTGHRPVNDIFDDRNHIFIDESMAIIGDKSAGKNHNLRLITLCDTAKRQLRYYVKHLASMSNRISKFDIKTAQKLKGLIAPHKKQSLPFLLLLSVNKKGVIETKGVCKKDIEKYWMNLELPTNSYRHLMCDKLKENGLERILINFFMGHFLTGQNLLAPSSPIITSQLIKKVSTEIEKVVTSLGLQAAKGMSNGNKNTNSCNDISVYFPPKYYFGINNRVEKNKQNSENAKQLASDYLTRKHPIFFSNTKRALSDSALNKMRDYAMSEKKLKSLILNEFNKAIKQRAHVSHRKPERLFYLNSNNEKSALTNGFAISAQQYLVFRSTIFTTAVINITANQSREKKCVGNLIIVYLHCLSIDLPFDLTITDFYHLVKHKKKVFNGAICFESTYKNHGLVRYFPNSFSAKLILKLQTLLSKTAPPKNTIEIALKNILMEFHMQNNLIPNTLSQLKKVLQTGWVFNQSPSFHEYRKMKAFKPLPLDIRVLENKNEQK